MIYNVEDTRRLEKYEVSQQARPVLQNERKM